MKQKVIGSILLLSAIGFLMAFPLLAHFLDESGTTVRIEKKGIEPWFLEKERSKAVYIYFGYVGCTSICIPALNELSPLYTKIQSKTDKTAFYFVNLNPTQPHEWVEPFAQSFHRDFKGVYATVDQTNTLERDFNLAVTGDDEMSHSSNLYLMLREDNEYVLKRIYTTHPYAEKTILEDIERFGL